MADRRAALLALATYVAAAVLVVGPSALATPWLVAGRGVDLPGTIWIHWWVRTTVESLSLPVYTDLFFYPDGKNFFVDTGANYIDAWLGTPLQWAFGVPDFLDVLQVVIFVGNALAMQGLVGELLGRRSPWAAWGCGLTFALNPFAVQQVVEGRPTQAMAWFGVLAVRALLRLPQDRGWGAAVAFGVFTALQGMTYWYSVYFLTLALLPWALVLAARAPRLVLPRLAVAIAVAVAVASPFLVGIATEISAGNVARLGYGAWEDSPAASPGRWVFVVALLKHAATGGLFIAGLLSGRRSLALLAGAAVCVLFAVGGRVALQGEMYTNHLFVALHDTLPLLPRLGFPDRALMATFLLLPVAAAPAIARLGGVPAVVLALLAVGQGVGSGAFPVDTTICGVPGAAAEIRDGGGAVIFLPFGASDDALVHQTFHGQPMFGGMGDREADMLPEGYRRRLQNSFIVMLGGTLNDEETPIAYTRADREEIAATYRWVWLSRRYAPPVWKRVGYDPEAKRRRLIEELGRPVAEEQGYSLWDLRRPIPADAPGLRADAAPRPDALERLQQGKLAPGRPPAGGGPPPAPKGPGTRRTR